MNVRISVANFPIALSGNVLYRYKNIKHPANYKLPATFIEEAPLLASKYGAGGNFTCSFHIQVCFENEFENCTWSLKYLIYHLTEDSAYEILASTKDQKYILSYAFNASYPIGEVPGIPNIPPGVTAATEIDDGKLIVFFMGFNFTVFDFVTKHYTDIKPLHLP